LSAQLVKIITALLFALLLNFRLYSQSLVVDNFTIQSGLNSNRIYAINEDSKGYIWIGTDKGVLRYNGAEFVEIISNHTFKEQTEIYRIVEDSSGRIWFSGSNCKLFYFERNEVKKYEFNSLIEPFRNNARYIVDMLVKENGTLILTLKNHGTISIDTLGNVQTLSDNTEHYKFEEITSGQYFFNHSEQTKGGTESFMIQKATGETAQCSHKLKGLNQIRIDNNDRRPIFSAENMIIKYVEGEFKKFYFEGKILSFDELNSGDRFY